MASSLNPTTFKLLRVNSDGSTTQISNAVVSPSADGLRATLDPFGTSSTTHLARGDQVQGSSEHGSQGCGWASPGPDRLNNEPGPEDLDLHDEQLEYAHREEVPGRSRVTGMATSRLGWPSH